MRVVYYRHESGTTNFGDELNFYLWDKLLPPAGHVLRPDLLFFGVGTLLKEPLPPGPKLVFGAGAGYGRIPKVTSEWDVRFVRGQDTALRLGLSPEKAISDPGILVAIMQSRASAPRYPVAFMPRFSDADVLRPPAIRSGFHFVDPRWPVEQVLDHLAACGTLVTEALHGAVVADALRIPWLPVLYEPGHEFKWKDWLSMFEMDYHPLAICPSEHSLTEALRASGSRATLTDSVILKALLLRMLKEVDALRTEMRDRLGQFSPEYDTLSAIPAMKGGRAC